MADGYMNFPTDLAASRLLLATESGLNTSQDIEWRWDLALNDFSPASPPRNILDRWVTVGNHRVWRVRVENSAFAITVFMGNSDGTSRSGAWQLDWNVTTPVDGSRYQMRVQLNGDSGGNTVCTLWSRLWSEGMDLESDVGWVEEDSASVAGVQTFPATPSAPVAINNQSEAGGTGSSVAMAGKFYRAVAWGDLTKTTKLFDVDFRTDDSVTGTTWDDNVRTNHWALQGDVAWVAPTVGAIQGRSIHYDFANRRIVIESGV